MHYLVLSGRAPAAFDDWGAFRATLHEHADFLRRFVAEQGVQTNEVQRSWLLLPAFLLLAREAAAERVDLIELGPSAGLNLVWDRYRYTYERGRWGDAAALPALAGEERRPVPSELLATHVEVRGRLGVDLDPIDLSTDEGALLLRAFVWADQRARLERLDRAIEAVRAGPPELVGGDYVDALPGLLARRRAGALTVVFETASLGYVRESERRHVREALDAAAREERLGWISTTRARDADVSGWGLDARLLPGERRLVAEADFHGSWLEWLA